MPFRSLESAVDGMLRTLALVSRGGMVVPAELPSLIEVGGRRISKKTIVTYISKLRRLCEQGVLDPCHIRWRLAGRGLVVELDSSVAARLVSRRKESLPGDYEALDRVAKAEAKKLRRGVRSLLGAHIRNEVVLNAVAWVVSRAALVDEPFFPPDSGGGGAGGLCLETE